MILDKIDASKVTVTEARYGRMMVLSNDRYMGAAILNHGEYSEAEVDLWRQLLRPDMVVADVGANIGAHTVALARIVSKGLVFAFEPLPFLYRMMVGNVALNGLPNVLPIQAAVGHTRGTLTVPALDYSADDNYGGFCLLDHQHGNPAPLLRLDDVIPRLHFLKADVEGMELGVLQGAAALITRDRPLLYLEANPEEGYPLTEGPKQRELIGWMQAHGYDCYWHFAPHYNPDNLRGTPPVDDHERTVVSYNILAVPAGLDNHFEGLVPISRESPPTPKENS